MIHLHIPDWARIILVLLSIISFIPQLHRICAHKTSSGLSLAALLCNLIVATEQFTIFFFVCIDENSKFPTIYTHGPLTAGDWLNFVQTTVVWIFFLVQYCYLACMDPGFPDRADRSNDRFAIALYYSNKRRTGLVLIYLLYLLVSLVLILFDLFQYATYPDWDRNRIWVAAFWYYYHSIFLFPVISILGLVAIYLQSKTVQRSANFPASLSFRGLQLQAVIFLFVALSWVWRITFPWEKVEYVSFNVLRVWFEMIGWIATDNAIFAVGQGVILLLALRRLRMTEADEDPGSPRDDRETEPLLGADDSGGYTSISGRG
ncbi:hypothetical protein BJY04DRAFT_214839 [Aspergillus karnatakaensis]|uniref:PQ-loop repeat-containing protein n=1 Tax=Aspergillus karnatakaensis TaxID=1810916 RepID=UPI003CCD29AD